MPEAGYRWGVLAQRFLPVRRVIGEDVMKRSIRAWAIIVCMAVPAIAADAPNPPSAGRPEIKVPFPPIRDWSTLRIRLERTPCYGWCPGYNVVIAGDGSVSWFGEHYVEAKGPRSASVPAEKVRALYDAFVKADFFWTFDRYEAPITDLPTHVISISFDDHEKSILDYAGTHVGMPREIEDLEEAIDAVAGTKAWIGNSRKP